MTEQSLLEAIRRADEAAFDQYELAPSLEEIWGEGEDDEIWIR